MKLKIALLVALLSLVALTSSQIVLAAQGDIWLTPANSSLGPNQNFDLEVHFDSGTSMLGVFNFYFDFNKSHVKIDTSKGEGGISKGANGANYSILTNADDVSNGHFRVGGMCVQNCAKGTNTHLVTIHLTTLAGFTSGSSDLSLRVNELANELGAAINAGSLNGKATITSNVVTCTTCYINCGTCPQTNAVPTGSLDYADTKVISGWAFDKNKGAGPVTVHVYSNDAFIGQTVANIARNDLSSSLGSAYHGFSYVLPNLNPGTYRISVFAIDDNSTTNPELTGSPKTVTVAVVDNTPPTGTMQINNNAVKTENQNVTLTISGADTSGLSMMKVSNSNNFSSITPENYSTQKFWNLTSGDGVKTVYLWLQDKAGNWNTSPITDTINLASAYPLISNIKTGTITQNSSAITWSVSGANYCELKYGLNGSDNLKVVADKLTDSSYKAQLNNLSAGTVYSYYVSCDNEFSNNSISNVLTFTTVSAPVGDSSAPAKITNLEAEANGPNSVMLYWTSPGDDGASGVASQYDIRYSKTAITEANWNSASQLNQEPGPEEANTQQHFSVVGLTPETMYYFAMKTADEVPNWSVLSNVDSVKTAKVVSADKTPPGKAKKFTAYPSDKQVVLTWENPSDNDFTKSVLLRSNKPFGASQTSNDLLALSESVFYTASVDEQDASTSVNLINNDFVIIYEGEKEYFIDRNLVNAKKYYYALITMDGVPNYSAPVYLEAEPENLKLVVSTVKKEIAALQVEYRNLANLQRKLVESLSREEAKAVYNHGQFVILSVEGERLYSELMAKEKSRMSNGQKYALAYFIEYGTPTTERLGKGERAGVINSYFEAYGKLPRSVSDYQDVVKIANGRWPQRLIKNRQALAEEAFKKIYQRMSDASGNENDDAAITIMSYGIRPVERNLESESRAITIFRGVYGHNPKSSNEWDMVRAIAYSGASR